MYDGYDLLRNVEHSSSMLVAKPLIGPSETERALLDDNARHVGRNLHYLPDRKEILCHVPVVFRWTKAGADVSSEAFGGSSAAALAMHHFNTGNGSIVRELEGLNEKCPIRFTSEWIDSQSSGAVAMRQLTSLLTRDPHSMHSPQPCALLGSSWSSTTKMLATVTGGYDVPHLTSSASSVDLDNPGEYPTFARTHPSDASMALLSLDYLKARLDVGFVGVLYIDNAFGNSYNLNLLNYAAQSNITLHTEPFRPGASDEEVRAALLRLKETGYAYFLGVFFGGDYERIMTLAYEIGIAGPDNFWMFNGALASQFVNGKLAAAQNSALANATFGAAILTDEGGLPGDEAMYDRFLEQWKGIGENPQLLDYLNSKQPATLNATAPGIDFHRTAEFFESLAPSHIAAFSYDAVVGLGLSACRLWQEQQNGTDFDWDPNATPDVFTGKQHQEAFAELDFYGASGRVVMGPGSYSRAAESTYHVVYNILPTPDENNATLEHYQAKPLSVFDTASRSWRIYDTERAFVYADGSSIPPPQIPPLQADNNVVATPVRVVCLLLSVLAMLLSVGLVAYCTVRHAKHGVIKAAQPFFLRLLCLGSILLAASVIPTAIDDTLASPTGCTVACVLGYWLFPIGFCLMFSALFSKLWRINQLMANATSFRRIVVTTRDVMVPLLVLMGANVLVLALWTALDTPYWVRDVLEYDAYGRPSETRGYCTSDHQQAFLWPLLGINGIALVLALWQAWVGRHVTTDFSESKYIGMATVCIFQSLFMGVPIVVIVNDNPTAYLFVFTMIVSVICFSILLLVFGPKVLAIRDNKEPGKSCRTTTISGIEGTMAPSSMFSTTRRKSGIGGSSTLPLHGINENPWQQDPSSTTRLSGMDASSPVQATNEDTWKEEH